MELSELINSNLLNIITIIGVAIALISLAISALAFAFRLGKISSRFETLEVSFKNLETSFKNLEKKFEKRFEDLEKKFEKRFEDLERKFEKRFEYLENKFEKRFEKFEKRFEKLEDKFEILLEKFNFIDGTIRGNKANNTLTQPKSPLSLNDKGLELFDKLDVKKQVDTFWSSIKEKIKNAIEKLQDSNPYTIQQECFKLGNNISSYLDDEGIDNLKTVAYTAGIDISHLGILYGIAIRDKFFDDEKIKVKEIGTSSVPKKIPKNISKKQREQV